LNVKSAKSIFIISAILILLTSALAAQTVSGSSLVLTINSEEYYNLGDGIIIDGTLMLDGSPVSDGLVFVQINDPEDSAFLVRAVETGPTADDWRVEIIDAFTCDSVGTPKSNFQPGGSFGFEVTVRNNDAVSQHVLVLLTLCYSNGMPFATEIIMDGTVDPLQETSHRRWWAQGYIPSGAPLGTCYAYTVASDDWTQYGGIAWCPEEVVPFNIVSSALASTSATNIEKDTKPRLQSAPGHFNVSFLISGHGGMLGTYTVFATSWYEFAYIASNQKTFEGVLIADVVEDGVVDMADISAVIEAFLATPQDPNWNPRADIIVDEIVDMADISIVIDDFLREGTLPNP
jgi:hypothetical protein